MRNIADIKPVPYRRFNERRDPPSANARQPVQAAGLAAELEAALLRDLEVVSSKLPPPSGALRLPEAIGLDAIPRPPSAVADDGPAPLPTQPQSPYAPRRRAAAPPPPANDELPAAEEPVSFAEGTDEWPDFVPEPLPPARGFPRPLIAVSALLTVVLIGGGVLAFRPAPAEKPATAVADAAPMVVTPPVPAEPAVTPAVAGTAPPVLASAAAAEPAPPVATPPPVSAEAQSIAAKVGVEPPPVAAAVADPPASPASDPDPATAGTVPACDSPTDLAVAEPQLRPTTDVAPLAYAPKPAARVKPAVAAAVKLATISPGRATINTDV